MHVPRDAAWWDQWFIGLARHYSTASKDPSTKVGAVIVDPLKRVVSSGYNGFPRGIADDDRLNDRPRKLDVILHAETNALLFAERSVRGCTAYLWPLPPCSRCAGALIQAGIARVVSPPPPDHWRDNCALARSLFSEAGVICEEVE